MGLGEAIDHFKPGTLAHGPCSGRWRISNQGATGGLAVLNSALVWVSYLGRRPQPRIHRCSTGPMGLGEAIDYFKPGTLAHGPCSGRWRISNEGATGGLAVLNSVLVWVSYLGRRP